MTGGAKSFIALIGSLMNKESLKHKTSLFLLHGSSVYKIIPIFSTLFYRISFFFLTKKYIVGANIVNYIFLQFRRSV